MLNLIEGYIRGLTQDDVNKFALNNNIRLTKQELDFTYLFIKNNYQEILNNPGTFDFSKYKSKFSADSYKKINQLINKYSAFL